MTTRQRRAAVTHLRAAFPVSERRACRLVRLSRSRWQYRSRRPSDAPLAAALRETAAQRPRWGYRRLALLLRRAGWRVNLKRVLRVYRAEGLRIRRQRRRKQVSTPRVPRPISDAPNAQWALDFITDAFAGGRRFRVLSVVDEWTRECLALRADVSQPSWKVVAVLAELAAVRGVPQRLISDNGPEFIARAAAGRRSTRGPTRTASSWCSPARPSPWITATSRASTTSSATSVSRSTGSSTSPMHAAPSPPGRRTTTRSDRTAPSGTAPQPRTRR